MEFSRQGYWTGLPFSSPGDLPDPGSEPKSPALPGGFFTNEPPKKPWAVPGGSLSFLSLDCDAGPRDREGALARLTCRGWSPHNWRAARGCPAGWCFWSQCGSAPARASRQSPPPGCRLPSWGTSSRPPADDRQYRVWHGGRVWGWGSGRHQSPEALLPTWVPCRLWRQRVPVQLFKA